MLCYVSKKNIVMDTQHRQIIKKTCFKFQNSIDLKKLIPYVREYKIFNAHMWKDVDSISDLLEFLPTRGPDAFHSFIEILKKADYNKEADILQRKTLTLGSSDELFYKMSTKPLGYCLIINNMKFNVPNLKYRYGSEVDAKSLQDFFEKAEFEVEVLTNLTSDQMYYRLLDFSKKDFTKVDSMILIIMSHGGHLNHREMLYGSDGGFIYKDDIYNIFSNENCKKLQTKPKVFFFIACRGTGQDYGVSIKTPVESLDNVVEKNKNNRGSVLSDVFIINSSLPYNVTVRDHEKGTYFCQALVPILNEKYKIHHLETLIKLVVKKLEGTLSEVYRIVPAAPAIVTFMWQGKLMLYRRS